MGWHAAVSCQSNWCVVGGGGLGRSGWCLPGRRRRRAAWKTVPHPPLALNSGCFESTHADLL